MDKLLKKFEEKRPEIVFEWQDPHSEACGWLVINSLRGGAAGGGTRMRLGLDKREVESLSKTMEVKFTVSGPPIGGAKSGINFDPKDPRKKEVLQRWYKAISPLLKRYYGTGGDMNVDEIHEVIPICLEMGVQHPQEGVFTGHFSPSEEQKTRRIEQLKRGVEKTIENAQLTPNISRKYTVSDMITGYGVAQSVRHYYHIWGGDLHNKKVIVQGWGNVASAAAFFLASHGAKIVGIIDRNGGLINELGYSLDEIKHLFLNKNGNELVHPDLLSTAVVQQKIWDVATDVFIPCAASRIVEKQQIDRLIANGLELVSCGANVPFADTEIFFGPIADFTDRQVAMIPDFIANCGMARTFAYLMSNDLSEISDNTIFEDVSRTIQTALETVYGQHPQKTNIARTAFEIALQQLV